MINNLIASCAMEIQTIICFILFINISKGSQFSCIGFIDKVDVEKVPEFYFHNYVDNLKHQAGLDTTPISLQNAFYVNDAAFLIANMPFDLMSSINANDHSVIWEPNVDIFVATNEHDIYCQEHNVSKEVWHIGRIRNSAKINFDSTGSYFASNNTESIEGEGTDVYILDTGIKKSHVSFQGRVTWGFVATVAWNTDGTEEDLNGHGTHVAGIVGADTYGIARNSSIISVKVLSRGGSSVLSDLIEGIGFATEHTVNKSTRTGACPRAICNLSLSFRGTSPALQLAIALAMREGLLFVVAAGNDDTGSCNYSPGNIDKTITVAASDINDVYHENSNFGSCIDMIAPGVDIMSAGISSDTSSDVMTGTSMATPMVTAGLAIYMSRFQGGNITYSMAMEWLTSTATKEAIDIPANIAVTTVNRLLFINCTTEEALTSTQSAMSTTPPADGLQAWEISLIVIAVLLAIGLPILGILLYKNANKPEQ